MNDHQGLDIAAIESLIRQSLSAAKAQGLSIAPNDYGVYWDPQRQRWNPHRTVCPLGSVLLRDSPMPIGPGVLPYIVARRTIAAHLAISEGVVSSFTDAFDGYEAHAPHDASFFALGQQLRGEWEQGLWG